jgi:hypothetical protein
MRAPVQPRRKPPKTDTERAELIVACARHLRDLNRAHRGAPADVRVKSTSTPRFVAPVESRSWCSSPAQLCAELGEERPRRQEEPPEQEEAEEWRADEELTEEEGIDE